MLPSAPPTTHRAFDIKNALEEGIPTGTSSSDSVATSPFSWQRVAGYPLAPQFEKDDLFHWQEEPNFQVGGDGSGPLFSMYLKMAGEEDRIMTDGLKADADRILLFVSAHVYCMLFGLTPEVVVRSILCRCCGAPYCIGSGPSTGSAG